MHALGFFSMARCLGEAWRLLAHVADHLPSNLRMVALLWRCPNVCNTKASGGLKSPAGPWYTLTVTWPASRLS